VGESGHDFEFYLTSVLREMREAFGLRGLDKVSAVLPEEKQLARVARVNQKDLYVMRRRHATQPSSAVANRAAEAGSGTGASPTNSTELPL